MTNDVKSWYKSRTFWFAVLTILAGVGLQLADLPALESVKPYILVVVGAINMGLRFVTTQPVGGSNGTNTPNDA